MANKLYDEASVQAIANAIRSKNKTETKYKISQMAQAIEDIPSVIKRVTGNPVEFTDGADAPLVKCVTAITGSQDLHGQDKPWVGGAGKNKLPMVLADIKSANTTGTWSGNNYTLNGVTFAILTDDTENVTGIKATGTASANAPLIICNNPDLTEGTSYIMNGCPATGSDSTYRVQYSNNVDSAFSDYGSGIEFTEFSHTYLYRTIRVTIFSGYAIPSGGLVFYPMIRLATVTDPTFAPYSNICPITAYTKGEIEVRGRNALGTPTVTIRGITFTQDSDGYVSASPNNTDPRAWGYTNSQYKTTLHPGSYSLIVEVETISANVNTDAKIFDSDDNELLSIAPGTVFASLGIKRYEFTIEDKLDIGVMLKQYDAVARFMIIKSTESSAYEPYTSTTPTTTFPSAIYRGSDDVVNGSMSYDMLRIVFDGSVDENWIAEDSSVGRNFYINIPDALPIQYANTGLLSNMFEASPLGSMTVNKILISAGKNLNVPVGALLGINTVADWKTWLSTHNLEVIYNTEQTTSSVTPTNLPIKSLYGYNHIESSTGEMEIDYITDAYQNFVDTVESALPNTRKGGSASAMDIFFSLDTLEETTSSETIKTEENNNSEDISENIEETR